jgi:hypothetical protein
VLNVLGPARLSTNAERIANGRWVLVVPSFDAQCTHFDECSRGFPGEEIGMAFFDNHGRWQGALCESWLQRHGAQEMHAVQTGVVLWEGMSISTLAGAQELFF